MSESGHESPYWSRGAAELAAAIGEHSVMIAGEVLATSFTDASPDSGATAVQTDLPVDLRITKA